MVSVSWSEFCDMDEALAMAFFEDAPEIDNSHGIAKAFASLFQKA